MSSATKLARNLIHRIRIEKKNGCGQKLIHKWRKCMRFENKKKNRCHIHNVNETTFWHGNVIHSIMCVLTIWRYCSLLVSVFASLATFYFTDEYTTAIYSVDKFRMWTSIQNINPNSFGPSFQKFKQKMRSEFSFQKNA